MKGSPAWRPALCAALAAVSFQCAPPTEPPLACEWQASGRPRSLPRIGCPADFEALGFRAADQSLLDATLVKLVVDGAALTPASGCAQTCTEPAVCAAGEGGATCQKPPLYFQDTAAYPLHQAFAREHLSDTCACAPGCAAGCACDTDATCSPGCRCDADCACLCGKVGRACELPHVLELAAFNATEYQSPSRRFLLGGIARFPELGLHALVLASADTASPAMIERMYRLAAERSYFGAQLRFLPNSTEQELKAAQLPKDIPLLTRAQLYAGMSYQPLNSGEAMGQVRILETAALASTYVGPRELLVLDTVPNDLPPVAGLITGEFQTPLAHVNVLSRNRGTPNMALRHAHQRPDVLALDGRWAHLVVTPSGYTLEEVSADEAERWWQAHRPAPPTIPAMDLREKALLDLSGAGLERLPVIGAKAANLAEISSVPIAEQRHTFDSAPENALPEGWTALGGSWKVISDPAAATSGGYVLAQTDGAGGPRQATLAPSWRNFTCRASVTLGADASGGLVLKGDGAGGGLLLGLGAHGLRLVEAGTGAVLAQAPLAFAGGTYELSAELHDGRLRVRAAQRPTGASAEWVTFVPAERQGRSCGLFTGPGSTARFDDVILRPLYTPRAFAIPFAYFRQFMVTNGFDAQLEQLRHDEALRNDGNARRAALESLQARMRAAEVGPELKAALESKLAAEFPGMRMRFRSSSNVEDLGSYTGAGLYESATGDPGDPSKPIWAAVKKVWASLYAPRAYEEREHLGIDHAAAGMAVLVHRAYPAELANGVAITANVFNPLEPALYINAQEYEISVTNPPPGTLPDQLLYSWALSVPAVTYLGRSTVSGGRDVLSRAELDELSAALLALHRHYEGRAVAGFYALDVEFKFDAPERALVIKQARPYPKAASSPQ